MVTLFVKNELKTSSLSKAEALISNFTQENNHIPSVSFPKYPNMAKIDFTTQGIVKLLHELKPGKSAGLDNIPTWILKEFSLHIAPI